MVVEELAEDLEQSPSPIVRHNSQRDRLQQQQYQELQEIKDRESTLRNETLEEEETKAEPIIENDEALELIEGAQIYM
jgi:hypothetical protein